MMKDFEKFVKDILLDAGKTRTTIILFVVLFALSIALLPTKLVLAKMLPEKDSDTFEIYIDLDESTAKNVTKEVAQCIVDTVKHHEDVRDIEVFYGEGAPMSLGGLVKGSGFKSGENIAQIVVNLIDKHERSQYSFATVHDLRIKTLESCGKYGSENIKFVQAPAGPPVLASVVAELYGGGIEAREKLSEKILGIFQSTEGLVDADVLKGEIFQGYKLNIDYEKAMRSGIQVPQIKKILYASFEGYDAAYKNAPDSIAQIPIRVRFDESFLNFGDAKLDTLRMKLREIGLMNPQGMLIPLSELVSIEAVPKGRYISSKNLSDFTQVIAETDMVSQIYPLLDARDKIRDTLKGEYDVGEGDYLNLTLTDKKSGEKFDLVWDGELKVTIDTFIDLGGAFIAALVLIYLLMVVYYKSFALSSIVLLASFLSIIGVIFGHLVMDIFTEHTFFLTATSLIGYIALIGISSRNSLLLIDFAKSLYKHGESKVDAIAIASATRARPIFLTAGAIILASSLLAGDAVFGGLGVALIGGTFAAVGVSLILVPILLYRTDFEIER